MGAFAVNVLRCFLVNVFYVRVDPKRKGVVAVGG